MAACVLLTGCGALPFLGGDSTGTATFHGPVKVALVDVLSGTSPYATLGTYLQNSAQLQVDALNAQGGVLGMQVQLVPVDDKLDPATTATVVRQAVADRSVRLVIGPSLAGLYVGVRPLVTQAKVPNCLPNMAADDLMVNNRYAFRAHAQDHANVPTLLAYLQKANVAKKIGLIAENDGIGQDRDSQLSGQAARFGLQYVGAAFVPPTGDQKAQVQQLLKVNADAVILSDNWGTAAKTLQAISALKATTKLKTLGFSGLSGYGFPAAAGDGANGLMFVSPTLTYLSDLPEARWPAVYHDFVKKAQAKFGAAPNGVEMKATPTAAACVADWARAVQAAGTLDGTAVAKAWERLDVPAAQSLLGVREHFAPDVHDAVPLDGLGVYQWAKTGDRWALHQLVGPTA